MTRSIEELTKAFEAGELDVETLSKEEQDALLNAEAEEVLEEESTPKVEENVEQVVEEEGGVEDSTPEPKVEEEGPTLKQKLYETQNELNTVKQKYQNLEKRKEAPQPKPNIDRENMWNDDVVAKRWEKLEEIDSKFELLTKREQEFEAKKARDEMFSEVSSFQKKTPGLSTSRNCEEIDKLFIDSWNANEKEPTIEEMKSLGVSEKDFKNYKHLSEMVAYKKENNLRNLSGAYYDSGKASELEFTDPTESAKRKATKESYERAEAKPKVLGNGYGGETGGWDDTTVNNWLIKHPDPAKYTPEQKKIFNEIYSTLD